MAAQQAELELLRLLGRDGLGYEPPEARVDAVRVLALAVSGPGYDVAGSAHAVSRAVREGRGRAVDGARPDVVDRELVAGEH